MNPSEGIPESFGINPAVFENAVSFIEAVRAGISGQVVRQAVQRFEDRDLFVRILGTSAPNLHRYYSRKALSRDDSEEILDTIRVFTEAQRVWGSEEAAKEWLHSPVTALGGERPIQLFDTFEGRKWVRQVLRKIEFGDFS